MTIPLGRLVDVNHPVPELLSSPEAEVTFMPLECVWPDGGADTSRRAVATSVASGYTQFRNGDVLVPKITPTFEAGRVTVAHMQTPVGAGTTELHVLRPKPRVDARFVAYVCRSQPFLQDGATRLQGVGNLRRVPAEFISKFPVPSRAVRDQSLIADYLDRETAQMNNLIKEQQRLIELLTERRGAVIDESIDPSLGRSVQLRRLTATPIEAGVDARSDSSNPLHWPRFVRTTDIRTLTSLHEDRKVTVPEVVAMNAPLQRDDLVATRAGATVGKASLIATDDPACFAGYLVRIRPDRARILPMYLAYWTASRHYSDQVSVGAVKSTIENFSAAKYRSMVVPMPDLETQRAVIDHLTAAIDKIDDLISEADRFIELSKERRSALITAAVTGQIDVRQVG